MGHLAEETKFPIGEREVFGLGGNYGVFEYEDGYLSYLQLGREQELLFSDGETRLVKKYTKVSFNELGEVEEIDP